MKNNTSKKTHVFIPAFNEAGTIGKIVEGLRQLDLNLKVFVIDDGSYDGTAKIAENAGAIIVKHPINLGGGAAIRTAFIIGIMNDVDYFITLDGDGQHDPKDLPKLVEAIKKEKIDLVIGSRFLENKNPEMNMYRDLGIRFFSTIISKITKKNITDATSGFRIYNAQIVKTILPTLKENQYYALEILSKIAKDDKRLNEVAIKNLKRIQGSSKKGILKYCYNLFRVIIRTLFL